VKHDNGIRHWAGGALIHKGKRAHIMGRGFPCCCSGDRAMLIAREGRQTWTESVVNCKSCLAIMAQRVQPQPNTMAWHMGVRPHPEKEASDV